MSTTPTHAAQFDAFARYYDADYRNYDDDVDLILTLAAESGDRVLELGCGTGRLLLPLAVQGHAVTGVDISPALLSIARSKLAGWEGAPVELVQADIVGFQRHNPVNNQFAGFRVEDAALFEK